MDVDYCIYIGVDSLDIMITWSKLRNSPRAAYAWTTNYTHYCADYPNTSSLQTETKLMGKRFTDKSLYMNTLFGSLLQRIKYIHRLRREQCKRADDVRSMSKS